MAPPDRQPDPGHPAIQGLDPIFSHAPEIAAWIEWLLHPEEHDGPRIIYGPNGPEEIDGPVYRSQPGPLPTGSTVIPGVYIEQMFDPAFALTGQNMDLIADAYDNLNYVWWHGDDQNNQLNNGILTMLPSWDSDAKELAADYAGAILDFYTDHNKAIFRLAKCYLAYAGVIHEARQNMHRVMGALVKAFHHKQYAGGNPWQDVALTALGAVATAALTLGAGATVAATAWATAFVTVTTEVAKEKSKQRDDEVAGQKWLDIVHSYFRAIADVLNEAKVVLAEQVMPELQNIIKHRPSAPTLPPAVRNP